MEEWQKIALTSGMTLLGGVLLLIASEFIKLLIVVPLKTYRDHVTYIRERLDFHSNYITNFFSEDPSEEERELMRQISTDFRNAATQLGSIYAAVTLQKALSAVNLIANREQIQIAYRNLIFLSNNLPRPSRDRDGENNPISQNHKAIESVKNALR